jgi:hypothetical protein
LAAALTLGGGPARAEFLNPGDFTSLGAFPSAPLITIDTNSATMFDSNTHMVLAQGVFGGAPDGFANGAVFTFDSIGSPNLFGLTIIGTRPLALLSYGDINLGNSRVDVSGNSFFLGTSTPSPGGILQNGGTGGGSGGAPGRVGQSFGNVGNGGSPGGLVGGYGFGNDIFNPGGSGGGAVELVALRRVTVGLAGIQASGGGGGAAAGFGNFGGGGDGGGGGILIKGDSVSISGNLTATGGTGGLVGFAGAGGGGGGGRVQIAAGPGGFDLSGTGSIGVGGGAGGFASSGNNLGGPGSGGAGGAISIDSVGPLDITGTFNVAGGAAGGPGASAGPAGSVTIVPEPAALTLMALGALGLAMGYHFSSKNPPGPGPGRGGSARS